MGDEVIVEFINQDWHQPRVIGFLEHPKECCAMLADFKQLDPLNEANDDTTQYILGLGPKAHVIPCDDELTFQVTANHAGIPDYYSVPKDIPTLLPNVPKDQWYLRIIGTDPDMGEGGTLDLYRILISVPEGHRAIGVLFRLEMAITVTVSAGDTSNGIKIYNYLVNESGLQHYKIHEQSIINPGYYTISVDFTYAGNLEIHFLPMPSSLPGNLPPSSLSHCSQGYSIVELRHF